MELTVSGEAFRGILKDSRFGQKLGKGYIRDATVDLSFDGKELRISVLTLDAKIPAAGAWEGVVQLPLKSWKVLQKVPPSKDELVLRFDESTSKLSIGTTGFKATLQKIEPVPKRVQSKERVVRKVEDKTEHDGKCELDSQEAIIDVFGSWENFQSLPDEKRKSFMERFGVDGAFSGCRCAMRKRNRGDFIRLWTAAGAAKNYNKKAWVDIESQLMDANQI